MHLLILFLVVPLAETWLLIKLGGQIGALPTIALCVLTAVIGSWFIKRQGLRTIAEIQLAQSKGLLPAQQMLEGMLLLLAGVLLLTPGLFTDAVGFSLLLPGLRASLAQRGLNGLQAARPDLRQPNVYEGDFRREDDDSLPPR